MNEWEVAAINTLIGLIGAGVGSVVTQIWKNRRASDKELFLFLRGAFDRPAFKGPYLWHSDHQAFQEAVATTLKAVKTGRQFDGRGQEVAERIEGRFRGSFLICNPERREAMQDVEDRLQRIFQLSRDFATAADEETRKRIDSDRDEVIRTLNLIWRAFGIPDMRLPTEVKLYEEVYDLRT
jgi:hypothetical protein